LGHEIGGWGAQNGTWMPIFEEIEGVFIGLEE
jgi:hypothetical protein